MDASSQYQRGSGSRPTYNGTQDYDLDEKQMTEYLTRACRQLRDSGRWERKHPAQNSLKNAYHPAL